MKHQKIEEIFQQYINQNGEKNTNLLEQYQEWFVESSENGKLQAALLDTLKDILKTKDLKRYDFVLLLIQALIIDFTENDKHFELIFLIADAITEGYTVHTKGDYVAFLLWQLTDICIHRDDELNVVSKTNPKLIPKVVRKIGSVKYELKDGNPMDFAALKSINLVWYMSNEDAKEILEEIFLNHFDTGVVEDAKEIIQHLKEEGRYQ